MYYCIKCNEIHHETTMYDMIFKTGFKRVDGEDVPLGTCNDKVQSKETALLEDS